MAFASGISSRLKGDRVIWFIVAMLSLFSVLLIYSSTKSLAYKTRGGDTEYFLIKQMIFVGAGILFMYLSHLVNYTKYGKVAWVGLGLSVVLLIYTLFSGTNIRDARRWIELPVINLSFQTSDFAKMALILYVAKTLSITQDKNLTPEDAQKSFWQVFVPILVIWGLIAPANLSTALMLFFTCICLLFIGRIQMNRMWYMLLLAVGLFACLILLADAFPGIIRVSTWTNRLHSFMTNDDPDVRFQVEQAKIAIAKGGWFGVGPGNGAQSNFLPQAYSDYIFCIIIEEYGLFFGGLTIIALYLGLLYRCVRMVTRSPKAFGSLLALGLCISLVLQAFAHMAVNVNLVPVTGLTLPMVSLGGTSLIFSCISLGIILSVSRYMDVDPNGEPLNRPM